MTARKLQISGPPTFLPTTPLETYNLKQGSRHPNNFFTNQDLQKYGSSKFFIIHRVSENGPLLSLFKNNSAKHWPILLIFGTQLHEKTTLPQ